MTARLSPPRPLDPALNLDLASFCCGEPSLDEWLRGRALRSEARTARTFVVCEGRRVVGYYCLAAGEVRRAEMAKKLQRNTPDRIPVFVLGRLAVDKTMQGRGLGQDLLLDCLGRCVAAGAHIGARGLLVHALEPAVAFYRRQGFAPLLGNPLTMFLPIETIVTALEAGRKP